MTIALEVGLPVTIVHEMGHQLDVRGSKAVLNTSHIPIEQQAMGTTDTLECVWTRDVAIAGYVEYTACDAQCL